MQGKIIRQINDIHECKKKQKKKTAKFHHLAGKDHVCEISQWDHHEKVTSLFFNIFLFQEASATSVSYTSEKPGMLIPVFTVAGFASSSSELDSSELDSSFFAGGFLAGVPKISWWDDQEKVTF